MKRRILATLACLALVFAVVGCASTPAQRYMQAEQALTAANQAAVTAVRSGLITDRDTLKVIDVTLDSAGDSLDKAHTAIAAGQTPDANAYLNAVFGATDRILAVLAEQQKAKSK